MGIGVGEEPDDDPDDDDPDDDDPDDEESDDDPDDDDPECEDLCDLCDLWLPEEPEVGVAVGADVVEEPVPDDTTGAVLT